MKKVISLLIAFSMMLLICSVNAAVLPSSTHNTTETYKDKLGNTIGLEYGVDGENSYSVVYVNGVLSQKAYINPSKNEIIFEDYFGSIASKSNDSYSPKTQKYLYSDFITENTASIINAGNIIQPLAWNPAGWTYYGHYDPSPIYAGAKPTDLYMKYYDSAPNLHKFSKKNVTIGAGTPISIAVGLVATYVTGGITATAILATIGASIIADIITNAVSGELCYSTQKILYAPIVSGINVFPDAYITKLWLISYDYYSARETFTLANESYQSNRGQRPDQIAINAQIAML